MVTEFDSMTTQCWLLTKLSFTHAHFLWYYTRRITISYVHLSPISSDRAFICTSRIESEKMDEYSHQFAPINAELTFKSACPLSSRSPLRTPFTKTVYWQCRRWKWAKNVISSEWPNEGYQAGVHIIVGGKWYLKKQGWSPCPKHVLRVNHPTPFKIILCS